ncbi:hypothetical protein [Crocosphaera sp.]|uniref:hypothetical protein n=1 Tax=Crocosphaera sp. TaxID=2729996 RepID=UPI0026226337|nr:hypothetical protein [Crocosphaera sp.]MDJ0580633.1 hypothetical protein [Crocosphaera sp.]
MLSTDIQQESMIKRIKKVVSTLMEEDSLFREDLNYSDIVDHLTHLFNNNLPFQEFNTMSDEELKHHCSGIMSIEILSKVGEDFTPEQMKNFDEGIKRK